jgi:hypothetical protein
MRLQERMLSIERKLWSLGHKIRVGWRKIFSLKSHCPYCSSSLIVEEKNDGYKLWDIGFCKECNLDIWRASETFVMRKRKKIPPVRRYRVRSYRVRVIK